MTDQANAEISSSNQELERIANSIFYRIDLEISGNRRNRAVMRADAHLNEEKTIIWLLRDPMSMNSQVRTTIQGTFIDTLDGEEDYLKMDYVVSRDSVFGKKLITNRLGNYSWIGPKNDEFRVGITSLSEYVPQISPPDAINGKIQLPDGTLFPFRSLQNDLNRVLELKKEIYDIKLQMDAALASEVTQLEFELDQKTSELKQTQLRIKQHIAKELQLRDLPILDQFQETVKRSKVLDGPLVINGGPGTGKTTALIQRIKFLTNPLIEEELLVQGRPLLTEEEKAILFDKSKGWIFFSPSELLRNYLTNAMQGEGLKSDRDHVTTWTVFRKNLQYNMGLINGETGRPFYHYKPSQEFVSEKYFIPSAKAFRKLRVRFEKSFFDFLRGKCSKIEGLDLSRFDWKEEGQRIQVAAKQAAQSSSLEQWIQFYHRMMLNFQAFSVEIGRKYSELIKQFAAQTQAKIRRDKDLCIQLENDLEKDHKDKAQPFEEEFEDEELEVSRLSDFDFDLALNKKLQELGKKLALSKFDDTVKFSKKDEVYLDRIQPYIDTTNFTSMGQLSYYRKYFAPLTKGIDQNILKSVPTAWKRFRRNSLKKLRVLTHAGEKIWTKTVTAQNQKIHDDELDFLFYEIFSMIRMIFRIQKRHFLKSSNSFIQTYREMMRGVVAIDEATDFSVFELAAMHQLSYPGFRSTTLSGDLMQKMTPHGIDNWEDFLAVTKGGEVANLNISYRQTPILLDIARKLYIAATGKVADYQSYTTPSEFDKPALYYKGESLESHAKWVGFRIAEIWKYYGRQIPTVAVFVANDRMVGEFAELLNNHSKLNAFGIETEPCREGKYTGDRQYVRVFSIEYIKGLEFQAVFFIGLDRQVTQDSRLLAKQFYVGLSRANFFLGVTIFEKWPNALKAIEGDFSEGGWA